MDWIELGTGILLVATLIALIVVLLYDILEPEE